MKQLPTSIYIHFPWCIKKCPYCDFNSYAWGSTQLPQEQYYRQLVDDLSQNLFLVAGRKICSVFMGGGTPSLFSPKIFEKILTILAKHFVLADDIEITLEANPGTIDLAKCRDLRLVGINRISLGVQSLRDQQLQVLQRIHSAQQAHVAIDAIIKAGFVNYNLDLMFGIPGQTVATVLDDLHAALKFNPPHLSWYQLTIEPNTLFAAAPPTALPNADLVFAMQRAGQAILPTAALQQYEISAYAAAPRWRCRHNLNYWEFGDYLGIGAGAHSKITTADGQVVRLAKIADPQDYLLAKRNFIYDEKHITGADLFFEFMLNALRLNQPIPLALFCERTKLEITTFWPQLVDAEEEGLLRLGAEFLETTSKGKLYLNNLLEMLLP